MLPFINPMLLAATGAGEAVSNELPDPTEPSFFATDILARWDASTIVGNNGSTISTWDDVGPSGTFDATGVNSPTLVTNDAIGRNIVRLDSASSKYFTIPSTLLTGLTGTNGCSAVFVWKGPEPNVGGGPVLGDFGTDAQSNHFPYTDGNVYEDFCSTARKSPGAYPTRRRVTWHTAALRSKTSLFNIRVAEATFYNTATNTFGVNTSTTPYIGRSGSAYSNSDLGEIIIFSRYLTDAEVAEAEGYLQDKWLYEPTAGSPARIYTIPNSATYSKVLLGNNGYRLIRSTIDSWQYGFVTHNRFSGDFLCRVRSNVANKRAQIGVTTDPAALQNTIDYGVLFETDGTAATQTNTTTGTNHGAAGSNYFFFKRVGSTLELIRSATTDPAAGSVLETWSASGLLWFTGATYSNAGSFDLYATTL